MKTFSIILIILLSGNILPINFSQPDNTMQEIAAAIRSGDAVKLAAWFDNTVDITLPALEGTYSKSQAEMILRDFFTKTPPSSFVIDHEGSSDNGSIYMIGIYKSSSASYRVYTLIKKITGTYYIQQLQFDTE
jgi:hypothetical protein